MLHEIAHNDFGTTRYQEKYMNKDTAALSASLSVLNVGSTEAAWRIFDACDSGESCDDEDQPDV